MNSKVMIYSAGLVHCSVCAPSDMPISEVEAEVNVTYPIGLSHGWTVDEAHFADGSPNPHPCEKSTANLHYLMVC